MHFGLDESQRGKCSLFNSMRAKFILSIRKCSVAICARRTFISSKIFLANSFCDKLMNTWVKSDCAPFHCNAEKRKLIKIPFFGNFEFSGVFAPVTATDNCNQVEHAHLSSAKCCYTLTYMQIPEPNTQHTKWLIGNFRIFCASTALRKLQMRFHAKIFKVSF